MGPAFTLALDNERLQAQSLAQLEELRASRARIVETGDLERRRLERDLHDGAQHRLLAASYEIRLATADAASSGDARTAAMLSGALDETLAAVDELRELAQGLFPMILHEAGVAAALMTLADTAPLVVDTRQVPDERYPAAVELAAYLLVVEAVDDAHARQASSVTVRAHRDGDVLDMAVEDDGHQPLTALVRSADRVGALGGTLETGPNLRRAMIPCA
jgi:signal transduction histidine kinase